MSTATSEMYVLTASYISSAERLACLKLCIESVKVVLPDAIHVVSVYADPGIELGELPCRVLLRENKMTQFQQINLLLDELTLKDDDFVMLLDDDDLVIAKPMPTEVLRSTQALYLGEQSQSE